MSQSKNPFRLGEQYQTSLPRGFPRRLIVGAIERLLGLHWLAKSYESMRLDSDNMGLTCTRSENIASDFSAHVLQRIGVKWQINDDCIKHIPQSGAAIIVANHPFGGLEGLILIDLLSRIRMDFCLLANYLINRIEELREHVIAVDPFVEARNGSLSRMNILAYRQALQWLKHDGLLVMFPSGAVSHASRLGGSVLDPEWSQTAVRLAITQSVPVIPICFEGQNSRLFQLVGLLDSRLRTALLPREMIAKRGSVIRLSVGRPCTANRLASFSDLQSATDFLRVRTYLQLAGKKLAAKKFSYEKLAASRPGVPHSLQETLPPVESEQMREEIACLDSDQLLLSKGAFDFFCTPASFIPGLLKEIGRLREVTFRDAGEGTGRAIDLDRFDTDYLHLFAWNREKNEVAGAYRLANSAEIVKRNGLQGLYTHSLFRYSHEFLDQLGCALEMGRSFVAIEYQRSPEVLFGLWQGIGEWVWRNPSIRTLFGTVSISRTYSNSSRQCIVEYLRRRVLRQDLANLVQALYPYQDSVITGLTSRHFDCFQTSEHLEEAVEDLEGKGIPVLLKHYLRLGAEAIAFGVDPGFADAVDILIAVDILRTELRRVERFMGRSRAVTYLQRHGIDHHVQIQSPLCSAVVQVEQSGRLLKQSSTSNR